ncbi:Site-specific DNA-methyltransferase [Bibersteinia trehalosi USDA-ARS-USMARC-189]|nr:Site-specific DNA-methyltransferase [Bibersteinia trehalosi USDA-ARS-USMARC-189]
MQDFSKPWTDEELYQKYGLSNDEIAFIEKMVRPMELEDE